MSLTALRTTIASFKKTLRERALRLPLWFHFAVMLTAAGVPLYWWVTFSGLFRMWVRSGEHNRKFIYVMLVAGFMVVGVLLTQILASVVPSPPDERLRARAAAFTGYDNFGVWMRRHSFKMKMALVAITAVAIGVQILRGR